MHAALPADDDAVDAANGVDDRVGLVGVGEDDRRRAGALVEVRLVDVLAGEGVGRVGEAVLGRQAAGPQAEDADDAQDEQHAGADPVAPVVRWPASGEAPPHAVHGQDVGLVVEPGPLRPEDPAAVLDAVPLEVAGQPHPAERVEPVAERPKNNSSAGSTVSMTSAVQPMPIAHTGPSPAVELSSANGQADQAEDDGDRGREIGGAAPFHAAIMASTGSGSRATPRGYRLISSSA